ncbi:peptidoglycan-binding domain-containing protein [Streptomyces sp. NPDC005389]|uniref:peptidoglycan-binding domain-containing protein n=1 Tax=Streptomyces sp. NPDC005389 TaxID=3157040 RepID=UPI0033AE483D
MRNRAALTTAVTPVREAARPEDPSDRVFGKVAQLDRSGAGARGQDIELFDAVARPPKDPAHAPAPSPGSHRSRPARPAPRARRPLSLPLMVAGAFSAGLAGALTVWLSADPEPAPPSPPSLSVAIPDLVTAAAPPANPSADSLPTDGTRPSTAAGGAGARAARTTPPPAPTSSARPSTTPSRPPTPTRSPIPTTTPPPSSHHPHRPERPTSRELALGSTGPDVTDLQRRLQRLHLYLGSADGVFTEYVGEALSRFQIARNIPEAPGVYGPLTRTALQAETD